MRLALILGAGGLLVAASLAHAEEKTYTFTLSEEQIQTIWMALDAAPMPHAKSEPLMQQIRKQYMGQQKPPEAPAPATPPAPAPEPPK